MAENRNAEQYVAGTLSDEERARFEEAMIERPELAADVNVRQRIKAGLSQLEQNNELKTFLAPDPARSHYLRYAAAAAVLVVVAAGVLTIWNRQAAAPLQALFNASEIGARPVAGSVILAATRSANVQVIDAQRNGGPIQLQILVDDAAAAPFAVHLVAGGKSSGAMPFNAPSISQITDGFAELYLDPRELESGDYTLSLKSPSGAEQTFPFTLNVSP